jgi:hypothetical protein
MRGLLALSLLVGCFSPKIQAGAPCPDDVCPDGLVCSPATKTCERTAVEADAGVDAVFDAPTRAIRYRRRISITNGAGAALAAGFTIRATIPALLGSMLAQSRVKADLSDLHVEGDGAIGERDRIIDPANGPAPGSVSFALQTPIAAGATSTEYSLTYGGDSAAAALARGTQVFPLYDDFTAGISTVWQRNDGPAAVNGKLVLRAGHSDALTSTAAADGVPMISALELVASVADVNSAGTVQGAETFFYWFGYQRTGDFTATAPWALWVSRSKAQIRAEQQSPIGCENQNQCVGTAGTQSTGAHYYAIERDTGATRFYLDGQLSYTATVTNNADYAIIVRNFMAASDVQIDWIRARARVSPDPVVTVGPEETY